MDHVGQQPQQGQSTETERHWLRRWKEGDGKAFQALVTPHMPGLMALARRHCRDPHWAEDLVQETLVRALRGLPGFRGDSSLRTWLFRILVRLAAEPARWRRGEPRQAPGATTASISRTVSRTVSLGDLEVPDHLGPLPMHEAIARELQDRLDEAMERLTRRQRTALHLRAVEGMDYAGISAILACSPVAARMHVLEARRKVLARVQEHLDP